MPAKGKKNTEETKLKMKEYWAREKKAHSEKMKDYWQNRLGRIKRARAAAAAAAIKELIAAEPTEKIDESKLTLRELLALDKDGR